jgi:hypothetical protein
VFGFKTVREQYFRVNPGANCIDVWAEAESATCCGVNLVIAGFGVVFLPLAGREFGVREEWMEDGAGPFSIRADAGANRTSRWVR